MAGLERGEAVGNIKCALEDQSKGMEKAVSLLDGVTAGYPEQDLLRLTVLEKAGMGMDPQKSARYRAQKQAVIDKNEAEGYNDMKIIPLVNALGQAK